MTDLLQDRWVVRWPHPDDATWQSWYNSGGTLGTRTWTPTQTNGIGVDPYHIAVVGGTAGGYMYTYWHGVWPAGTRALRATVHGLWGRTADNMVDADLVSLRFIQNIWTPTALLTAECGYWSGSGVTEEVQYVDDAGNRTAVDADGNALPWPSADDERPWRLSWTVDIEQARWVELECNGCREEMRDNYALASAAAVAANVGRTRLRASLEVANTGDNNTIRLGPITIEALR